MFFVIGGLINGNDVISTPKFLSANLLVLLIALRSAPRLGLTKAVKVFGPSASEAVVAR